MLHIELGLIITSSVNTSRYICMFTNIHTWLHAKLLFLSLWFIAKKKIPNRTQTFSSYC